MIKIHIGEVINTKNMINIDTIPFEFQVQLIKGIYEQGKKKHIDIFSKKLCSCDLLNVFDGEVVFHSIKRSKVKKEKISKEKIMNNVFYTFNIFI